MAISKATAASIHDLLIEVVREKLKNYKLETKHMPFHFRLLGRDRYAMFSFMQSMNTTFGISVWEQMAVILARGAGSRAESQYVLRGEIDPTTEQAIRNIHYRLRKTEIAPSKHGEVEQIRSMVRQGRELEDPDSRVGVVVQIGKQENYFDITSAKPNKKEFVALKLKLLRWTGLRLSQDRDAEVFTRIAIPYNPYHPEPYERWTLKGLFDIERDEIMVGAEFWNFVASGNIYEELLDLFEDAGDELRDEIDERFAELTDQ